MLAIHSPLQSCHFGICGGTICLVRKFILNCGFAVVLCFVSFIARAQLVTVDDSFGVPVFQTLVTERPGVLENDMYDGEPAEDGGATVILLVSVLFGTLECASNAQLELCPDGSFNYTPGLGFAGSDSFTYRATVGVETAEATVSLTACEGGPVVFVCWKEAEYLARLADFGYSTFQEGFEDDVVWASARSPLTAPSVLSQGILWESNHPDPPAENRITTGPGPALTGGWAVFDLEHGYATGSPAVCDVDDPPEHCLYKDGFTGIRQPGESGLYAAGGHFTGTAQPKLAMILDGGVPIPLGSAPNGHQFYGVINTLGFDTFRIEETDGKVGQARFVFADDFTFGTTSTMIFADGFE